MLQPEFETGMVMTTQDSLSPYKVMGNGMYSDKNPKERLLKSNAVTEVKMSNKQK